jgi:uncharacterized membrane protein
MSKYDYLHALYQALLSLDVSSRNSIMREIEDRFRYAEENGLSENEIAQELGTPQEYANKRICLLLDPLDTTPILLNEGITESTIAGVDLSLVHNSTPLFAHTIHAKEEHPSSPRHNTLTTNLQNPTTYSPPVKIQKNNTHHFMIGAIVGLTLFNAMFILGPFIAIWGSILALITAGIAIVFSGLLIIISGIFAIPLSFISIPLVVMGHPVLLFAFGFLTFGIGGLLTVLMVYSVRFCGIITRKYFEWNIKVIRGY